MCDTGRGCKKGTQQNATKIWRCFLPLRSKNIYLIDLTEPFYVWPTCFTFKAQQGARANTLGSTSQANNCEMSNLIFRLQFLH